MLILDIDEYAGTVASNPYPEAESEPKSLHLFFLASKPAEASLKTLDDVKAVDERFCLIGKVLYLHAPSGIARSRVAASAEKVLGVTTTARNWRSVRNVLDIAKSITAES